MHGMFWSAQGRVKDHGLDVRPTPGTSADMSYMFSGGARAFDQELEICGMNVNRPLTRWDVLRAAIAAAALGDEDSIA